MPLTLTAAADDEGRRLDRILRKAMRGLPLSAIHRLLRKNAVLVEGKPATADQRIHAGDTIIINSVLRTEGRGIIQPKLTKQATARRHEGLDIIFEGAGLLVLNKPAGLAVHGRGSLEERVRSYLAPKMPASLSFRSGPLHRLDVNSSGVIVFSTSLEGANFFSSLMREHKLKKTYLALAEGFIEKDEVWEDELVRDRNLKKTFTTGQAKAGASADAKKAVTSVFPLVSNRDYTLIRAEIKTGRTHQIRAQAASRGHPLAGDKKYGGRPFTSGFMPGFLLHARALEFPADFSAVPSDYPSIPRIMEAPVPEYFRDAIRAVFGEWLGI